MRGQAQPRFKDLSWLRTSVGLSGGDCLPDGLCAYSAPACDIANEPGIFPDAGTHYAVEYNYASGTLGLSYVRGGSVQIPCDALSFSSAAIWNPAYIFMQNAYKNTLIPIVTIVQNPGCPYSAGNANTDWALAASSNRTAPLTRPRAMPAAPVLYRPVRHAGTGRSA
jgi:hypothetical protein